MQDALTDLMIDLDLRDIHVPAGVDWWPPASGWWFIMVLIGSIGILAWYWHRLKNRNTSLDVIAAQAFFSIRARKAHTSSSFVDVYLLLRRIAEILPDSHSQFYDNKKDWIEKLDRISDCPHSLRKNMQRIPYEPPQSVDTDVIFEYAATVIERLPSIPLTEKTLQY